MVDGKLEMIHARQVISELYVRVVIYMVKEMAIRTPTMVYMFVVIVLKPRKIP